MLKANVPVSPDVGAGNLQTSMYPVTSWFVNVTVDVVSEAKFNVAVPALVEDDAMSFAPLGAVIELTLNQLAGASVITVCDATATGIGFEHWPTLTDTLRPPSPPAVALLMLKVKGPVTASVPATDALHTSTLAPVAAVAACAEVAPTTLSAEAPTPLPRTASAPRRTCRRNILYFIRFPFICQFFGEAIAAFRSKMTIQRQVTPEKSRCWTQARSGAPGFDHPLTMCSNAKYRRRRGVSHGVRVA